MAVPEGIVDLGRRQLAAEVAEELEATGGEHPVVDDRLLVPGAAEEGQATAVFGDLVDAHIVEGLVVSRIVDRHGLSLFRSGIRRASRCGRLRC